jgi:toxin ParE1/3/4
MPPRPFLTAAAERDLDLIWWWIARDGGVIRADGVIDRLSACMDRLAAAPLTGRSRPEFGRDRRSFAVRPYVIVYRPSEATIIVDRVVDGRRDLGRILGATDDAGNP